MEEEITSDSRLVELNEHNSDNKMKDTVDLKNNELNEDNVENEKEETRKVEDKVEDPCVGMLFGSIDDIMEYFTRYGNKKGFAVAKRTSRKGIDGEVESFTVACNRAGKQQIKASNSLKAQPQSKTGCKAYFNVIRCLDGWILKSMELDHNHGLSPSKTRFYKCNRVLKPHMKRQLELNAKAGIKMNKNFNSLVVEAGGHENLPFLEKDCRNHMDKVKRLELGEGDAVAMNKYFLKMQADNSNFFYTMDFTEDGRLKNVFWADARSREAFKEFGDVVTFDTTYLVNKYSMPFAPFVGVNHHGQSILLGCGLISGEDTNTFRWLFESWLTCMSRVPPSAIITDQDKAMKKAIEIVFPKARHRWCLWHILKKMPEKFKGYREYKSIKFCLKNVVYDSLTKEEFEERWGRFIEKYHLESHEWLLELYNERYYWVPAFVKDTFWAGMSTTQRSESINAFFDGYVHHQTTLKEFVEQYDKALAKNVVNENTEDFNSFQSSIPCFTHYAMEKQFQSVYTTAKYKEFRKELLGKVCCNFSSCKEDGVISEYEIREDEAFGENSQHATFLVYFNKDTNEVNCNCRFFEFRGILCRHQITVLFHLKIDQVPNKYILKRWSKNIKRSHTKVRINYDNWLVKPETQRFDKMYKVFNEVVDLAVDSKDKCEKVVARILELKEEFKQEKLVCGSNEPISAGIPTDSTSCGDDLAISKETKNILDRVVVRQKGRPPSKRKQSIVEKVVRKKEERKKKKITKITTKVENVSCTTPTTGLSVLGVQKRFNLNELELQQSQQIGKESNEESLMWPKINCPPNIIGMSPYYGLPNMLQGGNSPFQSSMIRQVVGMQPFSYHENTSQDNSPLQKACYDFSNEHPSNFIGKFGTNDVTKVGNPKLHEDGRGN